MHKEQEISIEEALMDPPSPELENFKLKPKMGLNIRGVLYEVCRVRKDGKVTIRPVKEKK
jgi:hypothetical protein